MFARRHPPSSHRARSEAPAFARTPKTCGHWDFPTPTLNQSAPQRRRTDSGHELEQQPVSIRTMTRAQAVGERITMKVRSGPLVMPGTLWSGIAPHAHQWTHGATSRPLAQSAPAGFSFTRNGGLFRWYMAISCSVSSAQQSRTAITHNMLQPIQLVTAQVRGTVPNTLQ